MQKNIKKESEKKRSNRGKLNKVYMKKKADAFSVLSLTENTLKLSLPFGQVKLSAIVKFTS